jgi:hypothetical protein
MKAREVLDDCRLALALLEDDVDVQRWRVHWAAAITLLRAVGHVLDKVDGADPLIKDAADSAFRRWKGQDPKHELFREFIERERNNLLKEYRTDVHPLVEVPIAIEMTTEPVGGGDPVRTCHIVDIRENVYRPLVDGPWTGDDARDVLGEAIAWWEDQLTSIDREVTLRRSARRT